MHARARQLRRQETDAERNLWARLRNRQAGGVKFRRQHPVGPFIADFCCPEHRLIIEIDGGQHGEQNRSDQNRTGYLEEAEGYRVLRFWNNEILQSIDSVRSEERRVGKECRL